MQIWQILCLWMHPWRSEAGGHPNSPFSAVNLSQHHGCAHQGSSAMGLSLMWTCFSLLLATPILPMDTHHKWSCRAPEVTDSNGALF